MTIIVRNQECPKGYQEVKKWTETKTAIEYHVKCPPGWKKVGEIDRVVSERISKKPCLRGWKTVAHWKTLVKKTVWKRTWDRRSRKFKLKRVRVRVLEDRYRCQIVRRYEVCKKIYEEIVRECEKKKLNTEYLIIMRTEPTHRKDRTNPLEIEAELYIITWKLDEFELDRALDEAEIVWKNFISEDLYNYFANEGLMISLLENYTVQYESREGRPTDRSREIYVYSFRIRQEEYPDFKKKLDGKMKTKLRWLT